MGHHGLLLLVQCKDAHDEFDRSADTGVFLGSGRALCVPRAGVSGIGGAVECNCVHDHSDARGFLVVTLVCGVPLYLLLRRYKSVSMIDCVVGGAAAALVFNLVLYTAVRLAFRDGGYSAGDSGGATYIDSHLTAHGAVVAAEGVVANLALGACIGFCFWLIALRPAPRRVGVLR